jgi:predicted flap endonuclease-1-like 5' DNA nuclease
MGTTGPATVTAPIASARPPASPPPVPPPQPAVAAQAGAPAQDLTRIRAIDEALQRQLYGLGVRNYADIANWRPDDVARISAALKTPGRIEQENWIEQAQILAKGGETYYSRRKLRGELPSARPTPDEGERITVRVAAPTVPSPLAAAPAPAPAAQSDLKAASAAAAAAAQAAAGPIGAGRDALQRIAGINAEVERLLNVQGVTRYAQIAAWTAADVARFDRLLGFEGRVARENWIEQAQILARGGETAYSRSMSRRAAEGARPLRLEDAIEARSAERREDLAGLRSVRSEAYRGSEAAAPAGSGRPPDDLKRIRGIGVLIEKKLNALGVSRYDQVANWSVADIERFSEKLDFRGRIERENWVEQARILSAGGQTEFSQRVDRGEVETSRPRS